MSDVQEQYTPLETSILEAQEKLREKNRDNPLLRLVTVDDNGIYWSREFLALYKDILLCDCLTQYVADLQRAVE